MDRYELNDRFAHMWRKSRETAGKSQEYMAKALGVSKKTVQNWEAGISCPNQSKGFEWFKVLGLQPMPYYFEVFYPEVYRTDQTQEDIEEALCTLIKGLPLASQKRLLYMFLGRHGSSVVGIIELINAHLQMPLKDRVAVAQSIATSYEIALHSGSVRCPKDIKPDLAILQTAITEGKDAVIHGVNAYQIAED